MTTTTIDHSETPEHVLRYFAPLDKAMAIELIKRRNTAALAVVANSFTAEIARVRELSVKAGGWAKVCDYLLSRAISKKMSDFHVTLAQVVAVAGVVPPGREAQI